MKEITRISLASLPYNIEVAAKKELEVYLHGVEAALGADADAMKEIESRIAELLAERGVTGEKVISGVDVAEIKKQLGEPKDFADEETVETLGATTVATASTRTLMRDTNNQIVGGVCSGLAAYTHVDVVWVRLGMVVLTVVTSGVMLLLYLIMWIITPPARTAAERLQMQGKPVTLEAIQEESTIVAKQNNERKTIPTMLRIMAGIGALLVAAAAIMSITAVLYHASVDQQAQFMTLEEKLTFSPFLLAGITFIVFCIVIARALFVNRYTKRFWITLAVLTVLGLGLFSSGVVGFGVMRNTVETEYKKYETVKMVDASMLRGAKALLSDGENTLVNYTVTNDAPKIEIRYNSKMMTTMPQVKVTRSGDTVSIGAFAERPAACMGFCQALITVDVYGPTLDRLTAGSGSVSYSSLGQKSLSLTAAKNTNVSLQGTKVIETLTASLEAANLTTTDANVATVTLGADNQSNVSLGTIASLDLTIPTTCAQGSRLNLDVATAGTVKINGVPWTSSVATTPCMNVTIGSQQ